jgi:hypothetical protein
VPSDAPFATTRIQGWQASATINWRTGRANLPELTNITCEVETNGLYVRLDRIGQILVQPHGISEIGEDGDERRISALSVRSIRLDGVGYAARAMSILHLPWRFTDIDYPREENDDLILPVFSGYLAVSRGQDGPWLPLSSLLDQLAVGKELDLGYRDPTAEDPQRARILHMRIKLAGLDRALRWCQAQFTSERAFRVAP